MRSLGLAPSADPSPMTREGTAALVEMFYALKRLGVGGGGAAGGVGATTPTTLGPKNTKRIITDFPCPNGCVLWKHERCPCNCELDMPAHLNGWHIENEVKRG